VRLQARNGDIGFNNARCTNVRNPAKPNTDSEGNPNGISGWSRTPSERSDGGFSILQEVFGFVKQKLSGAQRTQSAVARKGSW